MPHATDIAPDQPAFDDLVRLAAQVADVPIALITLVDGTLQRFQASVGVHPEPVPLERSMCSHAVAEATVVDVPDTTVDDRFQRHPMVVSGLMVRAYHGVPLVVPGGRVIGTLCVLDQRRRVFSPHVQDLLAAIARQVVAQFELRRASTEANAASRAKSDFLATMSHEIRTPMNAILGMTEIALSSSSQDEIRECLRRVQRNGEALLSLISDILDLSKVEADQLELDDRTIPLREVIEDALEGVSVSAAQKDLALLCLIDPDVPRLVRGDRARLRQVLVNLLGNAIKFTHSGEVRAAVTRTVRGVEIAVQDSGIGMTADEIPAVFDKFWRSGSVSGLGGTGLGLSI
ncbi:MAG: GAF domain-containing protein, partial [Myxococcales bacterium]|nr:GAF domain-containing protein [Myxococcales bacterium]